MAQLIVRNIGDDIVRALRQRAARHGRSAEAEHRAILRESLIRPTDDPSFKTLLASMPDVGEDVDFQLPRDVSRDVQW